MQIIKLDRLSDLPTHPLKILSGIALEDLATYKTIYVFRTPTGLTHEFGSTLKHNTNSRPAKQLALEFES